MHHNTQLHSLKEAHFNFWSLCDVFFLFYFLFVPCNSSGYAAHCMANTQKKKRVLYAIEWLGSLWKHFCCCCGALLCFTVVCVCVCVAKTWIMCDWKSKRGAKVSSHTAKYPRETLTFYAQLWPWRAFTKKKQKKTMFAFNFWWIYILLLYSY